MVIEQLLLLIILHKLLLRDLRLPDGIMHRFGFLKHLPISNFELQTPSPRDSGIIVPFELFLEFKEVLGDRGVLIEDLEHVCDIVEFIE